MPTYRTPGVYVEEISTLPPSVAEVATAIPAFVGYTQKMPANGQNVPVRITTLLEFETAFGGPQPLRFSVKIWPDPEAGGREEVTDVGFTPSSFILYYSLKLYFNNGGGPCWIVPVNTFQQADGTANAIKKDELEKGIHALEKIDEPTMIVFPDGTSLGADYYALCDTTLSQCKKLQDRFGIFDVIPHVNDTHKGDLDQVMAQAKTFRDGVSSDNLNYGAAYLPYLETNLSYAVDEKNTEVTYPVYPTPQNEGEEPGAPTEKKLMLDALKKDQTNYYNMALRSLQGQRIVLPPSPAMAGIYARVDRDRGVWKAPANVGVMGIIGPTETITNDQQDRLNVDATSGKSINVIRSFTGKGTLVWGARTLAGNDNEWRYVSVRRLFIMIEESIQKSTAFAVFEANDTSTWLKVKAMIDSYLYGLWQQGALAGPSPEAAYFVHVGLGKTMTTQDILEGRMIVEVGIAAVRPAEFIILRFSHKLQEA